VSLHERCTRNATYRNHDGHAEALEIVFDAAQTRYRDVLEFFFQIHDPSTRESQGNFWEAEPEHQDYLLRKPDGYTCQFGSGGASCFLLASLTGMRNVIRGFSRKETFVVRIGRKRLAECRVARACGSNGGRAEGLHNLGALVRVRAGASAENRVGHSVWLSLSTGGERCNLSSRTHGARAGDT
jgi:hypothetical protein